MYSLILASQSPRRQKLLRLLQDTFLVIAADVDEKRVPGESPQAYVIRLAREKAKYVNQTLHDQDASKVFVLAADTTVVHQDKIVGKPDNSSQAKEILLRLQNNSHQVLSGLAVYHPGTGTIRSDVVFSEVIMRPLHVDEIDAYVASGDPLDKAGAYAIQNDTFQLVPQFQDCFANVMGLPLCHLKLLLDESGYSVEVDVPSRCQEYLDYNCPVYATILLEGK